MATAQLPSLRIGGKQYPVVMPSWRDPRLVVAAVVISVLVIGVTKLGFRVSVPQILAAILAGALIEVAWTLRRTGKLVWPASALNTVVGIALILRIVGTESGDYWSWHGWYVFALIAAFAVFTKYVVRARGSHIFNPSNVALVLAFLLLGSRYAEPLDFWWAPASDGWMLAAYAIILGGGLFVAYRLDLLAMTLAFWLVLAAGLGLLAASGHCVTARWALQPVCGSEFWWVVVISPEILFFLFFMITDPKTIPDGRVARILFAGGIALVCTLLIAPQNTEFGAKVALLAGLALMSPLRGFFDRIFPEGAGGRSRRVELVAAVTTTKGVGVGPSRIFRRGAIGGAAAVGIALLIVAAGAPARQPTLAVPVAEAIGVAVEVDTAALPEVTVDPDVAALNSDVTAERADELAITFAENLAIEAEAMRRGESRLLLAADVEPRLNEMRRRFEASVATGEWVVATYVFDSLHLRVVEAGQFSDLGFEADGLVESVTYNADGAELRRETAPFSSLFILRRGSGDRWLLSEKRGAATTRE